MLCGITDIGSNTIRLSIYKWEDGEVKRLLHKKTMAGLVGYIEKKHMSEKGTALACDILNTYKDILDNFGINESHVFATAPLRNIKNSKDVVRTIEEETGIRVDVLSGEEEAMLGFAGATRDMEMKRGIVLDIGGGSTEVSLYDGKKVTWASSMPVGSLNLYKERVGILLPTKEDKKEIEKKVKAELKKLDVPVRGECPVLCGIGGTIRAATALSNEIFGKPKENTVISDKNVKAMLKLYDITPNYIVEKILQIVPDRIHTVVPGMLALQTVISAFGCESVQMSRNGVREGYFYEKVLGRAEYEKK